MTNTVPWLYLTLVVVFLVLCAIVAGLFLLRYKLTKESEAGTSLKLSDLLMLGSASWARGTRMDLGWQKNLERPSELHSELATREVPDAAAPVKEPSRSPAPPLKLGTS